MCNKRLESKVLFFPLIKHRCVHVVGTQRQLPGGRRLCLLRPLHPCPLRRVAVGCSRGQRHCIHQLFSSPAQGWFWTHTTQVRQERVPVTNHWGVEGNGHRCEDRVREAGMLVYCPLKGRCPHCKSALISANLVGKRKLCNAVPWPKTIVGVDMRCGKVQQALHDS